MRKGLKVSGVIILILATVSVLSLVGWRWFTGQAFPKTSGEIKVVGLSQQVEILRDQYGVAHIYAHTPEDLFFAEGYTHAQERFWQMEFQRRVAAGRLSEIFGENTLATDRYLRNFGFHQLAEQAYQMLDPESTRVVDAYTAGVNAYISNRPPATLGLEFALLGVQGVKWNIEAWTPADSLSWAEMMIFDQSDQMETELRNVDVLIATGQQLYNELHPAYRTDRPVIISTSDLNVTSPSIQPNRATLGKLELTYLTELRKSLLNTPILPTQLADLGVGWSSGSNSFVVSGKKTTTGMPLLANDPHMSINMPSLWYEVGLHCVDKTPQCIYNLRGFSLPGVPGILIGHNDRIAWGLTNASFDAEDVFIERINPQNPNQYEVNGIWTNMTVRREEIKVRGQDEPIVIFVRSTRNGVVATDTMIDRKNFTYSQSGLDLFALTYAWTALQPIRSAQAVFMVNRAQNWDEFKEALRYFDAGKQNWIYADVDGNIGYLMPGKVPVRAGGDGTLPVPGWNDDYIWTGFIPFEKLPMVFNPTQGFIVTANNPQVRAQDYPYFLGLDQDRGQRAERMTEMIQNNPDKISIDAIIAIQTDNQELGGLEIISYLSNITFDKPEVATARDRMLTWDGEMYLDRPEAALFAFYWSHLLADTFHDQLPSDLYPSGNHFDLDTITILETKPDDLWWDDITTPDIKENRDIIIKKAFEQAYAEGVVKLGTNFSKWRWGDIHQITFRNATLGKSGIGFIENIFNRGPFPVNGSETVVQKTCWNVNEDYSANCIPALRQILDLGNLGNSRMIHSVGQSGHPMHPHYDDFIELWRTFQYHPSNWERLVVEASKHDTLVLLPGK